MSTEVNEEIQRGTSVVDGINSPEKAARIARGFINALEAFRSEHGFQSLAELVDRIPKLEADTREKDKALRKASEDLGDEIRRHAAERQTTLQLYADESDRFRNEKGVLEKHNTDLQSTVSERDETITALKKIGEELKAEGRKAEETCKGKTNQLKKKEGELTAITKQLEGSQTQIKSLSGILKATKSEESALRKSLEEAQQRNAHLDKDLKIVRGKLGELHSFSVRLEDTDLNNVAAGLNRVWESATTLIRDFLNQDLPDDLLKRPWTALNDAAKFIMDTPLPQFNSVVAKELRIVKVLGILAEVIDKHMLQPTYQLSEDCQFRGLFYKLGSTEPNKERFLRGMVLSVLQDQRKSAEDHLVAKAVKEFMRDNGIEDVITPGSVKDFVGRLRDVLGDAQEVWRAAQYSTQLLASDFEYVQITGSEWSPFKLQAGKPTHVSTHDVDDDPIVLFPRIYLVLPGEEPKPITAGTVLLKSQIRAMIREERNNNRSAEETLPRSRNRSGRALSMSSDARNGHKKKTFLPQASASVDRPNA